MEESPYQALLVGRENEIDILRDAQNSPYPSFVAVMGRRRVGKTFLIRSVYQGDITFEVTGLQSRSRKSQLEHFHRQLLNTFPGSIPQEIPKNWLLAFHYLTVGLDGHEVVEGKKKIVFIDELPWMATRRSDFLLGLESFYNGYASAKNVLLVVCGSATTWMEHNLLRNTGGLYNRVTRRIWLQPFTLQETEAFLRRKHANFTRYQIITLYMVMGGIPHYLDQILPGESAVQSINRICFGNQGFLKHEFDALYRSIFNHPEEYEEIVRTLATRWHGMSRKDLINTSPALRDGGTLTKRLKNLELSGFITSYHSIDKKKSKKIYRLTDNYSLFFLKFIEDDAGFGLDHWQTISQTQSWKSWSGYAFENICLQHVRQVKEALGIGGVATRQYSYTAKKNDTFSGIQVDLLIERADNVISVCEVKFYKEEFELTEEYAAKLRQRTGTFRQRTKTKHYLQLVLISPYGLKPNKHSLGFIEGDISMNDLFKF